MSTPIAQPDPGIVRHRLLLLLGRLPEWFNSQDLSRLPFTIQLGANVLPAALPLVVEIVQQTSQQKLLSFVSFMSKMLQDVGSGEVSDDEFLADIIGEMGLVEAGPPSEVGTEAR
jgi:hypothetical protein